MVEDLGKTYANGTEAVRGVTIRVAAGECYGLLGPNGAGKSTTVGMLGTLVRPTSGRASVAGFDVVAQPREVRRRIGFAMQEVGVDALATARELLVLQGRLHGLRRAESARRARAPARHGRPGRGGRQAPGRVLGWHAATRRSRRLADAPARGRLPGRADRRPRPARSRGDLGRARPAATAARPHRRPHHPLHGGGRPAVRPAGDRRPRQRRGRGHPRRAQGVGRQRLARGRLPALHGPRVRARRRVLEKAA